MDVQQLSEHARARMQQRGIRQAALDLLLQYGRHEHDHRGAVMVFMDHRARRNAIRDCGRAAAPILDRVGNMFAVLAATGEKVVTVGHRYRRFERN